MIALWISSLKPWIIRQKGKIENTLTLQYTMYLLWIRNENNKMAIDIFKWLKEIFKWLKKIQMVIASYHKAVIPSSFMINDVACIIPEYFDATILPFTLKGNAK